jgi:hypothetical protein
MEKKIVGVVYGISKTKGTGSVKVCLEGEAEYFRLFDFNPNEVEFQGKELAGLTMKEAIELYRTKDAAYQLTTR